MVRAVDHGGSGGIRIAIAVGLVINFAGFVYDWAWHAKNLSMVPIPPSKLLTVHGAIYLGALVVVAAAALAYLRSCFTTTVERIGLLVIAAGLALEFLGHGTDMWAHGHGYEKDLYHNFAYTGAAMTVCGYLIIELFSLARDAGGVTLPADGAGSDTGSAEPAVDRSVRR